MRQPLADMGLILLVEDREEDIFLIRRAFRKLNLINPLHVVGDGEQALAYLKGQGRYSNRAEYPMPALVLLDLKMPKKNGFEVLAEIRQDPQLRALRVVVMTSSSEMRDVNQAYQLGANSFLVKPSDFENFLSVVQALQGYWIWLSKTPDVERPERKPVDPNQG